MQTWNLTSYIHGLIQYGMDIARVHHVCAHTGSVRVCMHNIPLQGLMLHGHMYNVPVLGLNLYERTRDVPMHYCIMSSCRTPRLSNAQTLHGYITCVLLHVQALYQYIIHVPMQHWPLLEYIKHAHMQNTCA